MWLALREMMSLAEQLDYAGITPLAAIVTCQQGFGQQKSGILNAIGVRHHLVYDGVAQRTFKEKHDRKKQNAA